MPNDEAVNTETQEAGQVSTDKPVDEMTQEELTSQLGTIEGEAGEVEETPDDEKPSEEVEEDESNKASEDVRSLMMSRVKSPRKSLMMTMNLKRSRVMTIRSMCPMTGLQR